MAVQRRPHRRGRSPESRSRPPAVGRAQPHPGHRPARGRADFDDASWTVIDPTTLDARRATGRLSLNWYRTAITIPDRIAGLDPTGSTVVFEVVVDDYAEVWVDGKQPVVLGQSGGALVRGFNAPNRVVLTADARPGQRIQIAVFGANGPLSNPPGNFIWISP